MIIVKSPRSLSNPSIPSKAQYCSLVLRLFLEKNRLWSFIKIFNPENSHVKGPCYIVKSMTNSVRILQIAIESSKKKFLLCLLLESSDDNFPISDI